MAEFPIHLNVLGYQEDGAFVALALEMDLRGYGDTQDSALADLDDQVVMQLTFAMQTTGSLDSAFMPAEEKYFQHYIHTKAEILKEKINGLRGDIEDLKSEFFMREIPVPAERLVEAMKENFTANHV